MPSTKDDEIRRRAGDRRVVRHGRASTTSSIADAIVIKDDELFFLCERNGDVPLGGSNGLGLYYHDCRYLDGYELRLDGIAADCLASIASAGSCATFELTNRDAQTAGDNLLEKERIGIKWDRTLDASRCALHDSIAFSNFGVDPISLPVTIHLRSRFESLFAVRGAQPKKRGRLDPPRWTGSTLHLAYDGADEVHRSLDASFDPPPQEVEAATAIFNLSIEPQATRTVCLSLQIQERSAGQDRRARQSAPAPKEHVDQARQAQHNSGERWVKEATRLHSDSPRLDRVVDRSLLDLHLLGTSLRGRRYFAAGVPWYVTLFGRDAIISALETLAFIPGRAEDTVRLLASFQGTHDDAWRDEEPGKIMHELRVGEMARLGEIPQTPYYGTVDATPLFLVLLALHAQWTGRLGLFHELEANVKAALSWIDSSIAAGGTGYLSYATQSGKGLANQGWKDSGDSIMNQDGSLATPPIALVEVQGYVFMAKQGIAQLYRQAGDGGTADRIAQEAADLRDRFERDFWNEAIGTYAVALQKGNQPAAVVTSNPGHALWTGIASPERARQAAERLLKPDMYSGWGIRTLSSRERRFNPIGYHVGTVWPHDNAIAVAGFRRYGCLAGISGVVEGMVNAASQFEHNRLPEVFGGFERREFPVPVRYPVACHPQAWAAGAVPFMMESALGLRPDAFNRRLHIAQPVLPESVNELRLERLRVGDAAADISFKRNRQGEVSVAAVRTDGELDVVIAS
ncbi:MAG TPA: glycogen debranching N-terminal domain-containing protein [Ramlibacter sp.]|nr:glycogen debranching N-terminal domain-containing protein [Ramlibacter sp.]